MWPAEKLKIQTEMLPALAQCCRRCPHVVHLLMRVQRGVPLPIAMWDAFSELRTGIESMATASWPMLLPAPETPASVTCAAVIRASELYRDACRSSVYSLEMSAVIRDLRGGDVLLSPAAPHPWK